MGFRIIQEPTAFALSPKVKRPRKEDGAYLKSIRMLPCAVCLKHPVDPAHLRSGSLAHGKLETPLGRKPDDRWVTPLCRTHHDEQHSMNELEFWRRYEIDPFGLALSLWGAKDDPDAQDLIVRNARRMNGQVERRQT